MQRLHVRRRLQPLFPQCNSCRGRIVRITHTVTQTVDVIHSPRLRLHGANPRCLPFSNEDQPSAPGHHASACWMRTKCPVCKRPAASRFVWLSHGVASAGDRPFQFERASRDGGVLGRTHQGPRSAGPPPQSQGVLRQLQYFYCRHLRVNILTDALFSELWINRDASCSTAPTST
jgi:hypothetical protein